VWAVEPARTQLADMSLELSEMFTREVTKVSQGPKKQKVKSSSWKCGNAAKCGVWSRNARNARNRQNLTHCCFCVQSVKPRTWHCRLLTENCNSLGPVTDHLLEHYRISGLVRATLPPPCCASPCCSQTQHYRIFRPGPPPSHPPWGASPLGPKLGCSQRSNT